MRNKELFIAEIAKKDNLAKVNRESGLPIHKESIYEKYVKRILDIIISIIALLVLSPVIIITGFFTWIDVGSPIVFSQERIGLNGKSFRLIKFRSMTNKTDENGNLLPEEERLTKFGRFIRKTSVDELISLFLVLIGKMSIIGPRPLPISFMDRFSDRHKMRYLVKPGLECPDLSGSRKIRRYQQIFENDIWYVENIGFVTDIRMLVGLFKMVFNRTERNDHADVGGGAFLGYDEHGVAFSMRNIPESYVKKWKDQSQGD